MPATIRSSVNAQHTLTATPTLTLPATIESGDLLLVFYSVDGGRTVTWDDSSHGTWTTQYNQTGLLTSYLTAKVAAGTEDSGNLSITLSTDDTGKWISLAIQDWEGSLAGGLASVVSSEGDSTGPDSPSLNPSAWGSEENLWITAAYVDNSRSVSTWPTNYSDNNIEAGTVGSNAIMLALATRTLTAASEDPGAWVINAQDQWRASTVAVRPAAAGGANPHGPFGHPLLGAFGGPI